MTTNLRNMMGEWVGLIWLRMGRSEMLFVNKVMELWVP